MRACAVPAHARAGAAIRPALCRGRALRIASSRWTRCQPGSRATPDALLSGRAVFAAIARIAGLCASITGGLSSSAQIPRLDHGRIQRRVLQPWKIDSLSRVTVTPDTREALATTLTLTADCEANGAVCTWDGRALSTGEARLVLVPGPETQPQEEGLTASFRNLPAEHDGTNAFKFRVLFSDGIKIAARNLQAHSLSVSGVRWRRRSECTSAAICGR